LVRQDEGRLFTSTGVILYAPVHAGRSVNIRGIELRFILYQLLQ